MQIESALEVAGAGDTPRDEHAEHSTTGSSKNFMKNKICLITGATSGIGQA
jgi:hypothetical protein